MVALGRRHPHIVISDFPAWAVPVAAGETSAHRDDLRDDPAELCILIDDLTELHSWPSSASAC